MFMLDCGSWDFVIPKLFFLIKHSLLAKMLAKCGYPDAHFVSTPADSDVHLGATPNNNDEPIPSFPYQQTVGSLLYLSTSSRPDISLVVTTVAKFASNPQEIHCTAVKRILKYLVGTINHGICFSRTWTKNKSQESCLENTLTTYADAHYGGDIDDRK